ncbi:MAG: AraC family transcriptional regulator [Colwellia sp.]|nr:AraC family transcriptional regulator [Colwellia sp.]
MSNYYQRFVQVINYIDDNLEQELSVKKLSQVAHLSKYHFHRQFSALFDMNLARYIRLCRDKQAGFKLAYRPEYKVIDIAFSCGFDSPEAFSRAFKKTIGQSPSAFRKNPDWKAWHQYHQPMTELRIKKMKKLEKNYKTNIVNFDETSIAVLTHKGAPELIGQSIKQFITWRRANKLPPSISRTFNLVYDDPTTTVPDDYRFDLCASTNQAVQSNDQGVVNSIIPSGKCVVIRHVGSDDELGEVANYLYGQWLEKSGETLRDFPLFFERVSFFPEVSEHQMITDVYLPLN